uniref:Thioesterase domain-containing protein n=1 Tax=Pipistrellus kuhlii TaxID=59472 RepID=A0A7J7WZZ1_PIPKU|nr:hypothetical protein mPipKuh1_010742 [Pipistrellus kuhlii]
MASWVLRMLPRNIRSLTTSSENQRVEDCHRHQEAYGYFLPIQTRWQDNDQYGHVNNVVYYSYFDTIINHYLISLPRSRPEQTTMTSMTAFSLATPSWRSLTLWPVPLGPRSTFL